METRKNILLKEKERYTIESFEIEDKDLAKKSVRDVNGRNVILVDDIYTEGVYVAEDCIQTLLNLGAKSVTLYVLAKTRS